MGRHDSIGDLLKTSAPRFETLYEPQVAEISRLVLEYVKSSQPTLPAQAQLPVRAPGPRPIHIGTSAEGFPVLPAHFNPAECTKRALEELYVGYLSKHYRKCNINR